MSDNRNSALTARARRYLGDAARAFDHAPVEVTLSVILAISFSWMLGAEIDPFPEWVEFAIVVALTGGIAFTATLLHALGAGSSRTRWLLTGAGALLSVLYGTFVLDMELAGDAWRAGALIAAVVLLILGAPSIHAGENATPRFRLVTGRLLLRLITVLLYAAALFAGLALAIGAVNTLFELDLNGRIYGHVFGWIFIVLVTWVVVGGVPDYVRPAQEAGPVGAAIHRLSAYLVTPLLAIYYIILYAYSVRIGITGELPKNLVSPLVIAAGLIAAIALILFDRATPDARSFRSLRAAAPLFIPLAVLGVWAITLRLEQYSWTEFRALRIVLLAALGIAAIFAVVDIVRRRPLRLHLLPLWLAGVLVVAVVGPWSVQSISRRSQQQRLEAAMGSVGIEWNATTVRDTLIANEPLREIGATSRYLLTHFGRDALPPLFAQHVDEGQRHIDLAWEAGLRPERLDTTATGGGFAQAAHGALLRTDDLGALYYVRIEGPAHRNAAADSTGVRVRVPLSVGGETLHADLTGIALGMGGPPRGERALDPAAARVPLTDVTGAERGELIVLEIGVGADRRVFRLVGLARLAP